MATEMDGAIAACCSILGTLFANDPADPATRQTIEQLGAMDLAGQWPFGTDEQVTRAQALLRAGGTLPVDDLHAEYGRLFVGPAHFEAPAWGSVYLDKDEVVFGVSNLELCQWMRRNGITAVSDGNEPQDHMGKMLLLLAWLADQKPDLVDEYLTEHLMPWAPRYLELLEAAARNDLYRGLAVLTRATLEAFVRERGVRVHARELFH